MGEAAAEFVRAGDHEVGAALERRAGELGVEAEVAPPGLVYDERDASVMGHACQGHDVGARAEVRRSDDVRRDRIGMCGQLRIEIRGRDAVRDAESRVDRGEDELQAKSGEDGAVDDGGVHRALHDRGAAE